MTIFLFIAIVAVICIYFLRISLNLKKVYNKNFKFNNFMSKSDFDSNIDKSDLISFRHEFGETIFELQKEIEVLRLELNNLKNQISNYKT